MQKKREREKQKIEQRYINGEVQTESTNTQAQYGRINKKFELFRKERSNRSKHHKRSTEETIHFRSLIRVRAVMQLT